MLLSLISYADALHHVGVSACAVLGLLLLYELWRLVRLWRKSSEQILFLAERSMQEVYRMLDVAEDVAKRGDRVMAGLEGELQRGQGFLGSMLSYFLKR